MRTSRSARHRVSLWMIGVLLLAQWLTSAYACPQAAARAVDAWVPATAVMAACHGMTTAAMDPALPALCKAHCEADKQAPVAKALADVPDAALAWFGVAGPSLHALATAPVRGRGAHRVAGPPGWPPLYLKHRVLRH